MYQGASEMLVMLGAHNVREANEEGRMEVHFSIRESLIETI